MVNADRQKLILLSKYYQLRGENIERGATDQQELRYHKPIEKDVLPDRLTLKGIRERTYEEETIASLYDAYAKFDRECRIRELEQARAARKKQHQDWRDGFNPNT